MFNNNKVTQIMAVSNDGFIGDGNTIPWRCREDMRHFATNTKGKVCIMGRKTFESIVPPLKDRTVIVVTSNENVAERITQTPNHIAVTSIERALTLASDISINGEIMIVGGKTIYEQTIQHTDQLLLSTIDIELKTGDTKFDWEIPDHVEIVPFNFKVNE